MLCEVSAAQVEQSLARLQAGDAAAFDELVRLAYEWLGKRVAATLRDYPSVRLPPDEVLHDRVLGRLRTALASQTPRTCPELTRLAGSTIRWALRDIVREQRDRPGGVSLDAASVQGESAWLADDAAGDLAEELIDHRERAQFHQAAAALPEPLRQVFCLRYYAGLSEMEVAAELGVTDRTVRARWREAVDAISVALTGKPFAGELPRLRRQGEGGFSPLCPTRKRRGTSPNGPAAADG
jgi:RNA polymerase sigma factor (sigma-70 family)